MKKTRRIVIKISGEQLAGDFEFGIDPNVARRLASEVKQIREQNIDVAIIVGGGNMVRGAEVAGNGIRRVTADQMGMLSSLINAMGVTDIFESEELQTRCMTNVRSPQLAEDFSFRLASKHLENGRVVILGGGIARPYFTTDTATVSLGLELSCEMVLKATNVDGVYDKDPNKFQDAKRYDRLTFEQVMENPNIKVMDRAALGLAAENKLPVAVFDVNTHGNLVKVAIDPDSAPATIVYGE